MLTADDPLAALQALARAWRRELGAQVIGITGSTGKTSTKDILLALLAPHLRTHANRQNLNTEIGLPLSILEAPPETRGAGARDGHARRGADRRAGRGGRARRGRDRERGPGAPGAAGHGRARGRGQGGAGARPAARRELRPAGRGAAAGRPPPRRPGQLDLRTGRRRVAGHLRGRTGRGRGPWGADGARAGLRGAPQPAQHAGRGGRGAGARHHPGGPGGAGFLVHARGDRGARRRGYRGQRLLQRQPDVDARGAIAPGPQLGAAAVGGPRPDGRAGPRRR